MNQKVTVTLSRFYFKELEITIDNELLKGMSHEEIADYLIEEWSPIDDDNEDEAFAGAKLQHLEVDIGGTIHQDTDRYDIYENNKQVFGGHL